MWNENIARAVRYYFDHGYEPDMSTMHSPIKRMINQSEGAVVFIDEDGHARMEEIKCGGY